MALFESSTDAVVSFGADFRILTVNPRTQTLFRYHEGDLLGHPVAVLLASVRPRPGRPAPPCDGLPPELVTGQAQVLLGRRSDGTVFAVDVLLTEL
ncbi:MAG TPA: PAS domain-containing protein, partial [Vicinamibacteria bacterium]|nr:PAS domain-containing protein [Vicinamibacteria bacterium]